MNQNAFNSALWLRLASATSLTSQLNGGTAGSAVYHLRAPENADPPYVTFRRSTGVPKRTYQRIVHESMIYTVKAVTQEPSAKLAADIMSTVDGLIDDQTFSVTGYDLKFSRRINDLSFTELGPGGQEYRHVGGMYHILIYPT